MPSAGSVYAEVPKPPSQPNRPVVRHPRLANRADIPDEFNGCLVTPN